MQQQFSFQRNYIIQEKTLLRWCPVSSVHTSARLHRKEMYIHDVFIITKIRVK